MSNNYKCPTCGGPVVFDGGLYHCDAGGDGAWDRESLDDEEPDREASAEQEKAWDEQYDGTSFGA